MGLDVYAGTLTRYYSGNWKTLAQQYAEENGLQFQTVRPGGAVIGQSLPPSEVMPTIIRWRDAVAEGLRRASSETFPSWEENNEKPYRTDKPDWDAYGALVLLSACLQLGETIPQEVERGWDWKNHPTIQKAKKNTRCGGCLVGGVEFWLPFEQKMIFRYSDIYGNENHFGTVGELLAELDGLNKAAWGGVGLMTIVNWRGEEGYSEEYELKNGLMVSLGNHKEHYATESLAKLAFSIFYELALFADQTKVPIKLDY